MILLKSRKRKRTFFRPVNMPENKTRWGRAQGGKWTVSMNVLVLV